MGNWHRLPKGLSQNGRNAGRWRCSAGWLSRVGALATVIGLAFTHSAAARAHYAASPYNTGITGYPPPPLAAGQSAVLLTDSANPISAQEGGLNGEAWDPVSGSPLTVTLWWRPLLRPSDALKRLRRISVAEAPVRRFPRG